MKKVILACSALSLSAALVGCGTMNTVNETGTALVGTGVGFVSGAGTMVGNGVNTGVGVVTGATTMVGNGVTKSVNYVTGQPSQSTYKKPGLVKHNGHTYRMQNGQYVRVR